MTKRIYPKRKNGMFNRGAPYWLGARAEKIVKDRLAVINEKKMRRKKPSTPK